MDLDLSEFSEFEKSVFQITQKIPIGKISTYGQIARVMGNIKYARAVGNALHKNPYPIIIPCHRVIKSNGEIGGFAKGVDIKIEILNNEKVKVLNYKIKLSKYIVDDEVLK